MRALRAISGTALAPALVALVLVSPSGEETHARARANVIVVMTDDQTAASLQAMPNVKGLLGDAGTTYRRSFATFPLCCPSRATFLTGQYFHNHGVVNSYRRLRDRRTLPVWLSRGGYATGFVGKYLNKYGLDRPLYVPPGWDEWHAAMGTTTQHAYDYRLNENGRLVRYGRSPQAFKQDVFTRKAVRFVARRAGRDRPFFLYLAYTAPHIATGPRAQPPRRECRGAAQPAPRHAGHFADASLPRPPSFNEANVRDKPAAIRRLPLLTRGAIARLERRHRCQLASLLSVDEGVAAIVEALEEANELGETVIVFTSDNGYLYGEHRIPSEKKRVYEPAIRVPLVVRGPGFAPGASTGALAANVDLSRTILDLAGVRPGLRQDGVSLRRPPTGARMISIESETFSGVRTPRYVYAKHHRAGERELYDLREDPDQLVNVARRPAYAAERRRLAHALARLKVCAGEACR